MLSRKNLRFSNLTLSVNVMNITQAIEITKKEFGLDVEILTEWVCEAFAEAVVSKVPGAEAYWDCDIDPAQQDISPNSRDPSHCFISHDGKYYDAACAGGVADWRNLPFFRARQYLLRS